MEQLNRIVQVLNSRAGKWWFDGLPEWSGGPGPKGKLTVKFRMVVDGRERPVIVTWDKLAFMAKVSSKVDRYLTDWLNCVEEPKYVPVPEPVHERVKLKVTRKKRA